MKEWGLFFIILGGLLAMVALVAGDGNLHGPRDYTVIDVDDYPTPTCIMGEVEDYWDGWGC